MADAKSVETARKRVGAAFKQLLHDISDRQICQAGSTKTREQLPAISNGTGLWEDPGKQSKPLAWLVHFTYDPERAVWNALLPNAPHAKRVYGGFNAGSPLQGLLCRLIPVVRVEATAIDEIRFEPHPFWEWALAFVFPDRAVFAKGASSAEGSSGAAIAFDPTNGRLETTIEGRSVQQPYVSSGLFSLVPREDVWRIGVLAVTYGDLTDALAAMIDIEPIAPPPQESDDA